MAEPVSIIVLCHNRWADTRRCLESLKRATPARLYELLVYDNASTDGTWSGLKTLARGWPQLRVFRNERNLPFAQGVNRGMRAAKGRYFLWLNNDTVLASGWLEGLLAAAKPGSVAGAGPMTNRMAPLQQVGAAFRTRAGGRVEDAPFLGGFCFLLKREAAARACLLDERFVWGWEDMDYCARLRQAGERLVLARDVFVRHAGSRTLGTMPSAERRGTDLGNRRLMLRKWMRAEPWRGDFLSLYERMPAPWHALAPRAAVLVICRGDWARARACLRSVRRSAAAVGCEVLAVDISERGRLAERLETLARGWPALKVLGPWAGESWARAANRAAAMADGSLLAILDADAAVGPGWLSALLRAAQARPDAGGVRPVGSEGQPHQSGVLLPRRVFDGLGGFDERFAGTLCLADLFFRLRREDYAVIEAEGAAVRPVPGRARPAPVPAGDRALAVRKWLDSDHDEFSARFWKEALPPHGLKPVVSVIVLCRGRWKDSRLSLESARRCAPREPFEVLAADLSADDETGPGLRALARKWPELRILELSRSMYHSNALNAAIRAARGAYLLILAEDARAEPGWIEGLLRAARAAESAAVVAPLCRESDLPWQQRPQKGRPDGARPVRYVRGYCLLIPREALARVGEFDDRFKDDLWAEDFCHRAEQRGLRTFVVDGVAIRRRVVEDPGAPRGGAFSPHDRELLFNKWPQALLLPAS